MARSSHHRRKAETPARRCRVRIDEIGSGGDGVATIDGARVFVPLTAPGDLAEVDLRGNRGTLVEFIEHGPDRATPACPHYGACGGCALQHVTDDFYRGWKRARVVDALARAGFPDEIVRETIETPAAARRRAVFAVRNLRGRTMLGFNSRRSSDIVDLVDCRILAPRLHARIAALRALAAQVDAKAFDLAVTLCDNGLDLSIEAEGATEPGGTALAALLKAMRAAGAVRLTMNGAPVAMTAPPVVHFGDIPVTPPPGGFLQASKEGEAALINLVMAATAGARKIADLFAGCGTFALPLAKSSTVHAVDGDRISIEALAKAAADAQRVSLPVNPIKTELRDLFERPLTAKELKGFDAVLFDPPRAGAELQAAEIAWSGVKTVIGVSCNPSTFARDAAILKSGGYALSRVTPVDQFVYSPHVELVGVFKKA